MNGLLAHSHAEAYTPDPHLHGTTTNGPALRGAIVYKKLVQTQVGGVARLVEIRGFSRQGLPSLTNNNAENGVRLDFERSSVRVRDVLLRHSSRMESAETVLLPITPLF